MGTTDLSAVVAVIAFALSVMAGLVAFAVMGRGKWEPAAKASIICFCVAAAAFWVSRA